ncbi:hypothetical protein T07_6869 [Trichinella nelsoni]|uniref:Uncharacterized protein n=1 Tax=Trichinella nelsoni TaxID=6336 RepID=A0A0V0SK97_9BILA|nr:hypothetical protein T07_6869 [Trichinella nelsoni]
MKFPPEQFQFYYKTAKYFKLIIQIFGGGFTGTRWNGMQSRRNQLSVYQAKTTDPFPFGTFVKRTAAYNSGMLYIINKGMVWSCVRIIPTVTLRLSGLKFTVVGVHELFTTDRAPPRGIRLIKTKNENRIVQLIALESTKSAYKKNNQKLNKHCEAYEYLS